MFLGFFLSEKWYVIICLKGSVICLILLSSHIQDNFYLKYGRNSVNWILSLLKLRKRISMDIQTDFSKLLLWRWCNATKFFHSLILCICRNLIMIWSLQVSLSEDLQKMSVICSGELVPSHPQGQIVSQEKTSGLFCMEINTALVGCR